MVRDFSLFAYCLTLNIAPHVPHILYTWGGAVLLHQLGRTTTNINLKMLEKPSEWKAYNQYTSLKQRSLTSKIPRCVFLVTSLSTVRTRGRLMEVLAFLISWKNVIPCMEMVLWKINLEDIVYIRSRMVAKPIAIATKMITPCACNTTRRCSVLPREAA